MPVIVLSLLLLCLPPAWAAEYRTPAGTRTAMRRPGAESILPGGRIIAPLGRQFLAGPGPFGLAVSPNGRIVVSANGGPRRFSLTVVRQGEKGWQPEQLVAGSIEGEDLEPELSWTSVYMGIAFADDRTLYASEGNSGRVREMDASSGRRRRVYELNSDQWRDSFTGDLVFDRARGMLYVLDQANFRVAAIDTKRRRVAGSVRVGLFPFAIALAPDGNRLYVTNVGMFEYRPIPGADRSRARETGLPFPAFGFPSPEARSGAKRETGGGAVVDVPGLGDPNAAESNSLAIVNVENAAEPKVEGFVRTGLPFGDGVHGGSSPSGVAAGGGMVFVSNALNDSITVVDANARKPVAEIPLRIPGLEGLRGVMPVGMAYHEASGWLLAAEAGINAVAVVDVKARKVLGHLPAGWFPTRVALQQDNVWVANAKGHGTGPNATPAGPLDRSFQGELRRGSLGMFPLPDSSELAAHTRRVMEMNGFVARREAPGALPAEVRHVVLIVKENRTFDEVFGDVQKASNGAVRGIWDLARFGRYGNVSSSPGELQQRFSLRKVNVTPNHHELAARYCFSDNFYADSEVSVDGHHWLVGTYPHAWTESSIMAGGKQKDFRLPTMAPGRLRFAESNSSVHPDEQPEAGTLWHHLARHNVTFRNFGEGFELAGVDEGEGLKPTGARFLTNVPMPLPLYENTSREYPQYNMNIPDQYRADRFIAEAEKLWGAGGQPFPRFVFLHLPNDHMAKPRPEDGYPFEASYVADNDIALGRIVEYLSKTPYWKNMAVFITEDDAQGGVDHIDSHRTVLLVAGPYTKKNYVSRVNSSFPGLLKTVFRLLGLPPLNLFDAAAADLSDCFTNTPDFRPYEALGVQPELFDPKKAREPMDDPKPSPAMDDPAVLREQHRRPR